MKNKVCNTFIATIWCGLQEYYNGYSFSIKEVIKICRKYTDKLGWCITVTPTYFVYKNGDEEGFSIGIINYPRFPLSQKELKKRTFELANILLKHFRQYRISIVFKDKTIILSEKKKIIKKIK